MKTKNICHYPIDLTRVTSVSKTGIAHVGDLVNSIDYDAPEGTPVLAALDGEVIAVKQDSSRGGLDQSFENDGNYIEILHANNEISEYEHLKFNSVKVKVGDKVKTRQVIAEVGNTGWSECPHLHFMVYPKGEEYKTLEVRFLEIRQGDKKDYGDVFRLSTLLDSSEADKEQKILTALQSGCVWIAEVDNRIVGYGLVELFDENHEQLPNSVFVSELYVLDEYRKQGIASEIIKNILNNNFPKQYTYFSVSHDPTAVELSSFYGSFGFKVVGKTKAGNIKMTKFI